MNETQLKVIGGTTVINENSNIFYYFDTLWYF